MLSGEKVEVRLGRVVTRRPSHRREDAAWHRRLPREGEEVDPGRESAVVVDAINSNGENGCGDSDQKPWSAIVVNYRRRVGVISVGNEEISSFANESNGLQTAHSE